MTTTTHGFTDLGNVRHVLAAGTYIITDPCYVFPDEMWDALCNKVFCKDNVCQETGVIEMDSCKIWWGQTKYGDGSYTVRVCGGKVGEFCVDAGLYAIFPLEFVKKYKPEMIGDARLACTTAIPSGAVSYEDGNMDCGYVTVCTGNDEDEDDEEVDHPEDDPDDNGGDGEDD